MRELIEKTRGQRQGQMSVSADAAGLEGLHGYADRVAADRVGVVYLSAASSSTGNMVISREN